MIGEGGFVHAVAAEGVFPLGVAVGVIVDRLTGRLERMAREHTGHAAIGIDDAFGDQVAADDAPEDVHQDRLYIRITEDQLEGLGDLLLIRSSTGV